MKPCPLARFAPEIPCRLRADGKLDRCHWIRQERLKAEYRSRGYPEQAIELAIWDRRVWTPGCRAHHDALDGRNAIRKIELDADDYPLELHEYAKEWFWFFVSPREGWVPDRFRLELAPPPGLIADFAPLGKDAA